jgi:hypothetical protein
MPARLGALEYAFFAIMAAVGFGSAWWVTRHPAWGEAALPPITWPIAAALLFDIVTAGLRGGGLPPLAMPVRAVGVFAAMALVAMLQGRI